MFYLVYYGGQQDKYSCQILTINRKEVLLMPSYFSYKEAMDYLNIKSKATFAKYLANGLPTIQVGNSKRISKSAIDKFMADHTVVATQDK